MSRHAFGWLLQQYLASTQTPLLTRLIKSNYVQMIQRNAITSQKLKDGGLPHTLKKGGIIMQLLHVKIQILATATLLPQVALDNAQYN